MSNSHANFLSLPSLHCTTARVQNDHYSISMPKVFLNFQNPIEMCQIYSSYVLFLFLFPIEFALLQHTRDENSGRNSTTFLELYLEHFPGIGDIFICGNSSSYNINHGEVVNFPSQTVSQCLSSFKVKRRMISNKQEIILINLPPISRNESYHDQIYFTLEQSRLKAFNLILKQISIFFNQKTSSMGFHFWKPFFIIQIHGSINLGAEGGIKKLKLPYNADIYISSLNTFNSNPSISRSMEIIEIYSIKNTTIWNRFETKSCSSVLYGMLQKDSRRGNFHKEEIIAVTMDVHGYELASDFVDNSTQDILQGGFEVLSYRYLKDALNFTEVALKGTSYIREGPNGTLTGMAAQINKGLADISISSTEFLEYRASGPDGISYLVPSFKLGMQAYFKQPPASSIRDVFISAFSLQLWILLFGLWMFICVSMAIAYHIYFKRHPSSSSFNALSIGIIKPNVNNGVEDWKDKRMAEEIVIWAAGAVCQQGWYFTPEGIPTRIIFFFGWFTGFMSYIAFSAQLVSILSVEVLAINVFEDLLRENFLIYNDNHIPTTKYYVKGLQERGIVPKRSEEMTNIDIATNIDKILKMRGAIVSISDSWFPILETIGLSETYICSTISELRIGTRSVIMSMFVKRNDELRGIFNTQILRMTERGINSRILKEYFIKTSVRCLKDRQSGLNTALGPKDMFTAYAILVGGSALAVVLMAMEFMKKLWSSRSLKNVEFLGPFSTVDSEDINETHSHWFRSSLAPPLFKKDLLESLKSTPNNSPTPHLHENQWKMKNILMKSRNNPK